MMRLTISVWIAAALAVLGGAPPSFAQSSDSGPALGVARISLINGQVTTQRGENGDWVSAGVNTPLVEGDTLETGPASRVEVQLDWSNLIRLDQNSRAEFTALGDRNFRVRLLEGRLTYSELKGGEADVDIETPFVAVRPRKNGRYEVEVGPVETVVQVHRGQAEIASATGLEKLDRGRMMIVREGFDGGEPEFRFARAETRDDWDRWNESRDDRLARAESYRYVDRSIAGAQDLDDHGNWRYVSGYGNCWFPRVATGWAPYRHGRWSWVDYYGWTWVGYEPWGWAPYHYGRWFYSAGYGWGWYPGRRSYRHFWRPALVGFFGWNSRSGFSLNVGIGFGRVGWVPLAPGERYYPWYGRGGGYWGGGNTQIRNSTIIVDNSVNIYNNYRNARAHNGVTVVDGQGFSQGRMNNAQSLRGSELQRATLMRGRIPVVPDRRAQGSIVRAGASATARTANVRTFSHAGSQTPTRSVARMSFNQQQASIAQSVREFRTARAGVTTGSTRRAGSATAGGSVRSGSAARSGSNVRGGAASANTRPSTAVRSGSRAGTAAAPSRAGTVRSGTSPRSTDRATVRSASPSRAGESSRWRTFEGSSDARSGVRSAGRVPSASRSGTTADRSRVNRSTTTPSNSRVGTVPRSTSRVPSASRSTSRAPSASRSTSRVPSASRSTSRVPSASRSTSRVPSASRSTSRAPSASRSTSRVPSASRSTSRVPSASRSTSRAPSASRSRAPQPSMRTAPSRTRSAPSIRTAPSRSSGRSGGSFGGVSRSRSSAPSRSSGGVSRSGGGSVRSAPSRSSGGARSARRR